MRAWHVIEGGHAEYSDLRFWDELVQRNAAVALERIDGVLDEAARAPGGLALAHVSRARSLFELGRLPEALDAARFALDRVDDLDPSTRSSVVMSAAVIVAESGRVEEGLAALEALAQDVVHDDVDLARIRLQAAYVLHQAGRLDDALAEMARSEQLFAGREETRDRIRVHLNRGLVLLQQGRLDLAGPDFEATLSLAEARGLTSVQAQTLANRAVLHGRARRLAESVEDFDAAFALFHDAGDPARMVATAQIDRAEVMVHSGLPGMAVDAARSAVELAEPTGNRIVLGDALLLQARAELAAGSARSAAATAARAGEAFADAGRHEMMAHVAALAATARLRALRNVDDVSGALDLAAEAATGMRRAGWHALANELALARVRAGHRWGVLDAVDEDVERLRRGVLDGRRETELPGWYAEAIGRSRSGDPQGAIDACRRGLAVLDRIVDEADTLEQRSASMQLGHDLSELTIDLAIAAGDPHTALAAAEGTRARALHDELAPGERHRPLTDEGARRLRSRLERAVGDRTLVEWSVVRDVVWATVLTADGSRLVRVADRDAVVRAVDRVVAWLGRAVDDDGPSARARRAAALLDDVLIAPLELATDGELVMSPVDVLHRVAWSGLPTLASRSVTLTPSLQIWLGAVHAAESHIRSAAMVVGRDVRGADRESDALGVTTLTIASGAEATAAEIRGLFEEHDLVHLAAHGTFRSDRPLLSTVLVADGPATLDAVTPRRVRARLVVLSSCEGGALGASDGSEVMGMSAVLLARGAAAVVAPLTVVGELECTDFVVDLHRAMADGRALGDALAAVRTRWFAVDDLPRWAVASSFTCFGSGSVAVAPAG